MSGPILPFPPDNRRKALRRRATGMGSAGLLALLLMDRDGEEAPANVVRFDEPEGEQVPSRSPELLLALLLFAQLPKAKKDRVKQSVRCLAYSGDADASALRLHHALKKL